MPDLPEFIFKGADDKPTSGQWHCGPNWGWITCTHLATGISATAYGRVQWKTRQQALMIVELMLEECGKSEAMFPEQSPAMTTHTETMEG